MKSSLTIIIFIVALIIQVSKSNGDARSEIIKMQCNDALQADPTIFIQNFVRTINTIATQIRTSHNVTTVVGTGPNIIYALAQCYGDLSSQDCISCYARMRAILPNCHPRNGGWTYLDGCFMRIQNYSFFEEYTNPKDNMVCGNTTKEDALFQESTSRAAANAVSVALRNNDYFAREEMLVSGTNDSVYVLAQCWKTLSPSSCRACLENASMSLTKCSPWSERRVLNLGCFMRYSDTNFLNPVPVKRRSSNKGKIIKIAVSVVSTAAVTTTSLIIILYIRKRRYVQHKRRGSYDTCKLVKILNDSGLYFKYSTVEKATGHWDDSNKIGEGGFGTVYKGVLTDGREIAVKRFFISYKFKVADFYNEIKLICNFEHPNLLRLLGCSCSESETVLIYEYMPNMSLNCIFVNDVKGREIGWEKRVEIIIGIAEGLVYLHENSKHRIIHRDIKASNNLLDLRFRPKIADFGLARSIQGDKSHISTAIAGTLGYMAPEYLAHGQLTEKVDVYSFGILILEVVTGMESNRSKTDEYTDSLPSTAWKHFNQGTVEEIFDPNLKMQNYHNINFQKDVIKVVHVALLCTQEAPSLRPSMSAALKMLATNDEPLPFPSNPPFIYEETMELNNIAQSLPNNRSVDDSSSVAAVSQSRLYPR
ncbi:cysteine-rich receptor-like protein kinase 2 [Bidens hawaiensis]|uniref:cysteine-rich receptor-like protein kinase 2 n=1 Tax=Bidens hawaiensis TaxID=980011 RepID=UPI00404A210C